MFVNVIGKEVQCLNKGIHDCVEPCKWDSKSMKKGLCIYGKMNEKTLIEEDRQIKRELKKLDKMIKILKMRQSNLKKSMSKD